MAYESWQNIKGYAEALAGITDGPLDNSNKIHAIRFWLEEIAKITEQFEPPKQHIGPGGITEPCQCRVAG
jgi:hypothetical protein